MNKSLRYIAILAILPLFTAGLGNSYFTDVEALKSQGTATAKYGSSTNICGLDLCSNYPGGKAAWIEDQGKVRPVAPVKEKHMEETRDDDDDHMDKTRDDDHMDKTRDDDHMDKTRDYDDDHMNKTDDDHMDKTRDDDHMDKNYDDDHMNKTDDDHMDKTRDDDHMDKTYDDDHMDKTRDDDHMDKTYDDDHMDKAHGDDITEADLGSVLRLSRANVPATIPLHQGYYNGEDVYFIITDSSDPTHADIITESQGWQVELAPLLANAPDEALSKTFMFTNGIDGGGIHGFQSEVFTSTPAQAEMYSALTSHVHVTWNRGADSRVLDSEEMIMNAAANNEITLTDLNVVLNMPHIVWPGGQMMINDVDLTDITSYGGGQVLDIDTEEMNVTFIAHRGWGPDGRTIYYIVTDATPSDPAKTMGVVSSPTSASLIANSAAVDLYQFENGLKGTGPLGFQPGIASGAPGDANYSPMWRISVVNWASTGNAQLLETIDDVNAYKEAGLINIGIARPMDSDHIVNCPFIDPFQ